MKSVGNRQAGELVPEPPASAAVERLLHELGEEACDVDDRHATQPR